MGMAASQARYLALTARKTNTEWEGQQINQARTALANQSANLFNQLLGLQVPNAPKTTDYTKIQYSYSDGNNDSVFEDWHQINTANPNYNYVVSHYYMADVYTGIQRMLQDPQVQLNNVLNQLQYDKLTTKLEKDKNANLVVTYKINDYDYDQKYMKITSEQISNDEKLKYALTDYEKYANMIRPDGSLTTDGVYGYMDNDEIWHFFVANDYKKIHELDTSNTEIKRLKKDLQIYETDNNLLTSDGEFKFDGIYKTRDEEGNWQFVNIEDYKQINSSNVDSVEGLREALYKFEEENDLLKKTEVLNYDDVYGYQKEDGTWSFVSTNGLSPITQKETEADEELKDALYKFEEDNGLLTKVETLSYDDIYGKEAEDGTWSFTNTVGYDAVTQEQVEADGALRAALTTYETENDILNEDGSLRYDRVYAKVDDDGNWAFTNTVGYNKITKSTVDAGPESLRKSLTVYEKENDLIIETKEINYDGIYGQKDDDGNWQFESVRGMSSINKEMVAANQDLKDALYTFEEENDLLKKTESLRYDGVYGKKDDDGNWIFTNNVGYDALTKEKTDADEALRTALTAYETENDLLNDDGSLRYDQVYGKVDDAGNWTFTNTIGYNLMSKSQVEAPGAEELKAALTQYEKDNNLIIETTDLSYDDIYISESGKGGWVFNNTIGYKEMSPYDVEGDAELEQALRDYEVENNLLHEDGSLSFDKIYGKQDEVGNWAFTNVIGYQKLTKEQVEAPGAEDLKASLFAYEKANNIINVESDLTFDKIYGIQDEEGNWSFIQLDNRYTRVRPSDIDTTSQDELASAILQYETEHDLLNEDGSINFNDIYGKKGEDGKWSILSTRGLSSITKQEADADVELRDALYVYEDENDLLIKTEELSYGSVYGKENGDGTWSFTNTEGYDAVTKEQVDEDEVLREALTTYETENNLLNEDGSLRYDDIYAQVDEQGNWTFTNTVGYIQLTKEEVEAPGAEELKAELTAYEEENGLIIEKTEISYEDIYGAKDDDGIWHFECTRGYDALHASDIDTSVQDNLKKALTKFEISKDLMVKEPGLSFDGIYTYKDEEGNNQFIKISDYLELSQEVIDAEGAEDLKEALIAYETENDLFDDFGNLVFEGIYAYKDDDGNWQFINVNDTEKYKKVTEESIDYANNDELREALIKFETEHGLLNEDGSINYDGMYGYKDSDNAWHFNRDKFAKDEVVIKAKDYTDYSTTYGPSHVGNSQLTELNHLIVDRETGLDQVSDLAQILRDCPDSAIKDYVSFDDYGQLQYEGKGIYTFDLYGKTYYTTYEDLMDSYNHSRNINTIDDQKKLAYYTASYVPQKVTETNQALIEKDSDGRFKNVKFDNDSAVYNLNFEEVVNEAAYDDAMNAYLNKKAQYEKAIADINAKTSIIQKEDRTLELRLKQLDTEQNALATEMDAVKKVIKDNIEKTFKTFSD